jgi:hypothetical protein
MVTAKAYASGDKNMSTFSAERAISQNDQTDSSADTQHPGLNAVADHNSKTKADQTAPLQMTFPAHK